MKNVLPLSSFIIQMGNSLSLCSYPFGFVSVLEKKCLIFFIQAWPECKLYDRCVLSNKTTIKVVFCPTSWPLCRREGTYYIFQVMCLNLQMYPIWLWVFVTNVESKIVIILTFKEAYIDRFKTKMKTQCWIGRT